MNELGWGVYLGVVSNLLVAAVLNNTVFEASGRTWLVTLGAWNELLGVLLVASPELIPRIQRLIRVLSRFVSVGARRIAAYVTDLLRRRPPSQTVSISPAVETDTAGKSLVFKSAIHGSDLAQQVEFLLRRTSEHERRLDLIEPELGRIREEIRTTSHEVRDELRRDQEALERRLADKRIALRLLGLLYVVLGLVLGWGGNLVGV
jgi:hypothetical protein